MFRVHYSPTGHSLGDTATSPVVYEGASRVTAMSQFNTSPNSELTIVGDPFLIDARASREREFTISIDFRDGKVDLGWKERVDGGATVELPDDSGTGIDGDDTPEPSGGDAGDGDGSEGPTSEN